MSEIEDQEFDISLDALRSGDRAEFAKLVDRYSNSIYRVALRVLNDPEDAEDVLQETFIKALRALPNFEGRSSLSTWLYRIAVNEALMLVRKRKPQAVAVASIDDDDDEISTPRQIVDWCCMPEEEMLSSEARGFLDRAIGNLSEALRIVFILRDIEGLSIRDTAETLGLSETAVKTRLLRARLKLREELTGYYGEQMKEKPSE